VKSRLTLEADQSTTRDCVANGINTTKLYPIVLKSTAIGDEEKRQLCERMRSKYCEEWFDDCAVRNRSRAAVVQSEPAAALTVAKELDKVLPEVHRRAHYAAREPDPPPRLGRRRRRPGPPTNRARANSDSGEDRDHNAST